MKTLIIYIAKKYIISALNDLLEKYKDNVSVICETIHIWTTRLAVVLEELKTINQRCSDGKIEDEEVKESVKEIESIIKNW